MMHRTFHQTRQSVCLIGSATIAISACLLASPAHAIPSPELIVGSISSISQLVTLVTAMLGGGAAIVGARAGSISARTRGLAVLVALVCVGSLGINVHQWLDRRDERTTRLEATLLRPAQQPGVPKLDPSMKELTYGQQLKHPMGLDTAAAETLLQEAARGDHPDTVFIDVRETAETEMGNLPGALAVRYPDFSASNLDLANKKAVLFCHNGNRSHETCEALAAIGIPCQFIIGGLEKWVVEKRAMTGLSTRSLDELRAIPAYANQRTLLDTEQAHALVQSEKAIFVDVRYPGEYAAGHLPDAINLSIRRQPSTALQSQIARLPKRPVVLPCYDRRGCFFAEVLGLELTRAGHDVRGRYTLPFEYFIASGRPPHVEKWIAEGQRSLWSHARDAVLLFVEALAGQIGLPFAILLMATLSRLAVLPLSLKAERDQIVARDLKLEIAALQSRTGHDAVQRGRAMQALYRRHGLTPVRNLLALAFLPIMALSTAAVHQAAVQTTTPFAWIPNLASRDPSYALPLAFGLLIAAYLHVSVAQTLRQRVFVWCAAAPILALTALVLGAAIDLYLVASAALLLVQRALVRRKPAAMRSQHSSLTTLWQRAFLPGGIISLGDAERLAGRGNKAYRLACLKAAGVSVPDGLLLTHAYLEALAKQSPNTQRRALERLWRRLGAAPLAVRSSAAAEDGAVQSFAGVFQSELRIDSANLHAAITRVKASFTSARAASYGIAPESGNILLQTMIEADYSGVLFTRDPASAGAMLVELVAGTADALVSGTVTPTAFRFGRFSLTPLGTNASPIELSALLRLGQRAETLFGQPQDIEWTYRDGGFHIVQSRDITRPFSDATAEDLVQHEWSRVLALAAGSDPATVVFAQNELSEMLPRPTPLSYSIMEALWAAGGSVDLACRKLGLDYRVDEQSPAYLVGIAGRLYVDKRQEHLRATRVSNATIRRLEHSSADIERDFRDGFLPPFLAGMTLLDAVDFNRMEVPDLQTAIERLHGQFMLQTHVEIDIINISAHFYLQRARTELEQIGLEPALCLAGAPLTDSARRLAEAAVLSGPARAEAFRKIMGHRSVIDYELAAPRYAEDDRALEMISLPAASGAAALDTADDPRLGAAGATVWDSVERARRFQTLKDDAKHHALREFSALRRAVVALDGKLGLDGLVYFLTFDEVRGLHSENLESMREAALHRRALTAALSDILPPAPALTLCDLERAATGVQANDASSDDGAAGIRVAGSRTVEGRCYRVSAADAESGVHLAEFEPGDIIVARMFHPAWLPYLRQCGGIVSELGGWLSHMALLAREHDIPMIVAARNLDSLPHQSRLRLQKTGHIQIIGDTPRCAPAATVTSGA